MDPWGVAVVEFRLLDRAGIGTGGEMTRDKGLPPTSIIARRHVLRADESTDAHMTSNSPGNTDHTTLSTRTEDSLSNIDCTLFKVKKSTQKKNHTKVKSYGFRFAFAVSDPV